MRISRATAIKLASFAGITAVASACHHFGLGESDMGLFGTALALTGAAAHAVTGHWGMTLIERFAGGNDHLRRTRTRQNRDLHRLVGEAIARILERHTENTPTDEFGRSYLTRAAKAFRSEAWMDVKLTGAETAVDESVVPSYFTGRAEEIKSAPVLEKAQWSDLLQKVAPTYILAEPARAREFAATNLREQFALELWEVAKDAWKTNDLAWPALVLRLLSIISGRASDAAENSAANVGQLTSLKKEVRDLNDAIVKALSILDEGNARASDPDMFQAIQDHRQEITSRLAALDSTLTELHRRHDRHDSDLREIKARLAEKENATLGTQTKTKTGKIPFDALIDQKTRDFVGREWLVDKFDRFSANEACGYFLIKGEPGIGKTALASWLVRERCYVHHFNHALLAVTTREQFIRNIAAQLIDRYGLEEQEPGPEQCRDGVFLMELLRGSSARLQAERKLVIVVDALDEADLPTSLVGNVLALPETLPASVYFIVTVRPVEDLPLWVQAPTQEVRLLADSKENVADIRQFIERGVRNPAVQERLSGAHMDEPDLVATLLDASEGNFMYLYHVLPAIERGEFILGKGLDKLPQGLLGYYERHWRQMRGRDPQRWSSVLLPVISILAVAREALSADEIATMINPSLPASRQLNRSDIRTVVAEWREFLTDTVIDNRTCYRIYHNSFREFLQVKDQVEEASA